MRKALALATALGVGLVLAVSPAPAGRIDGGPGGPTCADIVNGAVVDYNATTQTLSFALETAAPSCKALTYTVNVYSDNPTHPFIARGSSFGTKEVDPTGTPFLIVTVSGVFPAADSYCISATSSDSRVFDAAPDTGCISFPVTSSGGQTGFN